MSRLINPGTGELSDRLTILALKILHGVAAGRPVEHFQKEKAAILTMIRTREVNGKWFEAYTELSAVNAAIWYAEDALRLQRCPPEGKAYPADTVVGLAFRIQELNDRRAALIDQINRETGEADGVAKEKLS